MDIDKIPVLGKLNRTLNMMIANFVILAVIFIILAIIILFFPKVLDVLVAALLILAALVFLHMALNIYTSKRKYVKWLK